MKTQTKQKLDKLANHIAVKFGKEIVETTHFLVITKKEAEKIGVKIHDLTIKAHENYLISKIRSVQNDFLQPITKEEFVESPKLEIEVAPELVKIKLMFSDGTYTYFIPEPKSEKPVEEEKVWTGLFDYKTDKRIFIRRGEHTGCEITDIRDVLREFKTYYHVLSWIDYQLQPQLLSRLKFSPDTERDIKCLESFRSFILRKKGGQ